LVPGQYGSGGITRLGHITKAGDRYIRTLLILGARSVLVAASTKADRISRWAIALRERAGYGKALVAIAAKNARMIWAMLAKGDAFKPLASVPASKPAATMAGPCRPAG
jgi:transposase